MVAITRSETVAPEGKQGEVIPITPQDSSMNIIRVYAAYKNSVEPRDRVFKYREPGAEQMIEIQFEDFRGTSVIAIPVFAVPHLVNVLQDVAREIQARNERAEPVLPLADISCL
jgi:hypothetical protein